LPAARQGAARLPHFEAETRLRERLIGLGYREILTIPHVAAERDELFRPAGVAATRLANPLSEEAGVLRATGLVSMAGALEWNLNHSQQNVRLFEIGRYYRLERDRAVEKLVLTLGATGEAREQGLYDRARDFSFADLKGDIDTIGMLAGEISWEEISAGGGGDAPWLNLANGGQIKLKKKEIGTAGQMTRRVAERLKLRTEVFLAEIALAPFYEAFYHTKNTRRYEALPRFPAVDRDFSLLLPEGTRFSEVKSAISALGLPEITSIEAADLYRGKNVPEGKYSLLVRVRFQSREATLTDAQTAEYSAKIVSALTAKVGAQLRASA